MRTIFAITLLFQTATSFSPTSAIRSPHNRVLSQTHPCASPCSVNVSPLKSTLTTKYEKNSIILGNIGRLNLFGAYYGITSILLGLIWTLVNFITWGTYNFVWHILRFRGFDKARRFSVLVSHIWGVWLMRLTRCYPVIEVMEGAPGEDEQRQRA